MNKLKIYGAVLILIILIIFDVGLYSHILGIPIGPVTTITDNLFDALSGNTYKENREDTVAVNTGHSESADSMAKADDSVRTEISDDSHTAGETDSTQTADESTTPGDTKAPDVPDDSGSTRETGKKTDNADASEPAEKESDKKTGPGISFTELSGIPIYSTMNAPEYNFLKVVPDYDDNDYSYTLVTDTVPPDGVIYDTPAPVVIPVPNDEPGRTYEVQVYSTLEKNTVYVGRGIPSGGNAEIYNLTPGDLCGYQIFAEQYTFETESGPQIVNSRLVVSESFCVQPYEMRGIKTETLNNVRDLGGWPTLDGKHIRYGLLYRGSAFDGGGQRILSDNDTFLFLNRLGIRNELDLRWDSEIMLDGVSSLSDTINYIRVPMGLYAGFVSDENNGDQLNQIFDMLLCEGPLYFHCAIGCDRTGTISFLLLGLLGVSESDINKEYELSSFSIYGPRVRNSDETYYKEMIFFIKDNYEGATLQEKIQNYLLSRGVPAEKLEAFKAKMLE